LVIGVLKLIRAESVAVLELLRGDGSEGRSSRMRRDLEGAYFRQNIALSELLDLKQPSGSANQP